MVFNEARSELEQLQHKHSSSLEAALQREHELSLESARKDVAVEQALRAKANIEVKTYEKIVVL